MNEVWRQNLAVINSVDSQVLKILQEIQTNQRGYNGMNKYHTLYNGQWTCIMMHPKEIKNLLMS